MINSFYDPSFGDKATEDIFNGENSREARTIPNSLWKAAARKLDLVNAAHDLLDLRSPPGNRLELLKGSLAGFHSIRVNDQYRIVFKWVGHGADKVRVLDYHS
jgi:proteic killer suppression protein